MIKLLKLRVIVFACCVLFPASAYADAVRIGFGENLNAFSFTINGSAVERDQMYGFELGRFWHITFKVTEDAGTPDRLIVTGTAQHRMAPHGEGVGFTFTFNPGPIIGQAGMFTASQSMAMPFAHGGHLDRFRAAVSLSGVNGQGTSYIFHLDGRHCSPVCPELPAEMEVPEPATLLLLGAGLAATALRIRKKTCR